jgi:gamma-glutamyltranspeptidase / glutathione hydrolase / leukotriene-C4 hydrolase
MKREKLVVQLTLCALIPRIFAATDYGAEGRWWVPANPSVRHPGFSAIQDPAHVYLNAAVSTEVPLCSRMGTKKLLQGGNAMDAAIASAICVGIINSFSSGIGGGGFILVRKPGSEEVLDMIDFRETAPRDILKADIRAQGHESRVGGLAVGVPGEIRGLHEAHRKYGRLPWKELFKENIAMAKGFKATNQLVRRLNKYRDLVLQDPGLRNIYTRNNELIREGDIVRRTNYAEALERIAEDPECFYEGELAKDVVRAIASRGGVIGGSDLRDYESKHRRVLESTYYDYKVYTTSLPTSGLFVIEALNVLENFDVRAMAARGLKSGEYKHLHLMIEIFKFTLARRGELGDPDFLKDYERIVSEITSKETANRIADKIRPDRVLSKEEYGMRDGVGSDYGTTHINVIDRDEMVVLLTSTINLEFGAKFMDPKTGIIFNNQLSDFFSNMADVRSPRPNAPNSMEPGKRPLSSASPVLLVRDDEILALGAAGGMRIPTSIIGVLLYLSIGTSLGDAIAATRIHNQLDPETTYVEHDIEKGVLGYLLKLGHNVEKSVQNSVFTSVQGILLKKDAIGRKSIHAVSDPRKGGEPYGY